jgi:hypothetical protein
MPPLSAFKNSAYRLVLGVVLLPVFFDSEEKSLDFHTSHAKKQYSSGRYISEISILFMKSVLFFKN